MSKVPRSLAVEYLALSQKRGAPPKASYDVTKKKAAVTIVTKRAS